jgi:hypothetical protein
LSLNEKSPPEKAGFLVVSELWEKEQYPALQFRGS